MTTAITPIYHATGTKRECPSWHHAYMSGNRRYFAQAWHNAAGVAMLKINGRDACEYPDGVRGEAVTAFNAARKAGRV